MAVLPPAHLAPRELFELLCERRPTWPIEWLGQPLRVRPMTALEWAHARRDKRAALLYPVLSADGERQAFSKIEDVGALSSDDFLSLTVAVTEAINVVGPTYSRCDWPAWREVLLAGAAQSGALSWGLFCCVDVAYGYGISRVIDRPERFWGCSVSDLTDGHWMVFNAAYEHHDRNRPR